MLVLREKESLSKPARTVIVLLKLEFIWQQVPDRGTYYCEGLTTKRGEPVSWYDELQATGRPQALPTDDIRYIICFMVCC